jgi:hypothetical protein
LIARIDAKQWPLQRQCDVTAAYWVRVWGCIQLTVMRERGNDELAEAKNRILRKHQRAHFLDGLDKLGISRDLPPAVIAGRYHYFSNAIGNLKMEYIEESPKKVWIRYRAPSFSFTGIGLAAIRPKVQRLMFSGWHPFNGESLGCPQLGFVLTKVFQDGEPYDEGYFFEADRPLLPDERIQFKPVRTSPDFDPDEAPKLDPELWPDERLWRANRKFARGFVEDTIRTCLELYGVYETAAYIAGAQRVFALQFFDEYREMLSIEGKNAIDLAQYMANIFEIGNEPVTVTKSKSGAVLVTRENPILASDDIPDEIYVAMGECFKTNAKLMSARIRITLNSIMRENGRGIREEWLLEDTKERLF